MSTTAIALFGYILWILILILSLEVARTILVIRDKKSPASFKPDGSDVSPFLYRLTRVHANCYEHFPVFGGLLILSLCTGLTKVTDALAIWFLVARLGQSVTHLISTSDRAVSVRFIFFVAQLVIAVYWVINFIVAWLPA